MSQFRSQNKPVQKKPTLESAFKAAGISLEQFKKDKEKMKKPCIEVEKKACAGKRGIKNKKHFYVSNISNDPISKPGFEFYYPGITYKEPLDLSGVQKKASSGVNSCTSEPPKIRSKGILVPNKNGFIYKKQQNREVPKNNGIKPALTTQPDNEAELIIGLDFGTSSVKVVIHDYQRDIFYAVPFYPAGNDHRFFFPTRVWLGTEGYSLDCGETLITDPALSRWFLFTFN